MSKEEQKQKVRGALADNNLQTAIKRSVDAYVKARERAMDGFDFASAQDSVRNIKERSIDNLEDLFARFKTEAEAVGTRVYEASDAHQVADIVLGIAKEHGAKKAVKTKSMLTEELELNAKLIAGGMEVTETDLGEWIIQLAGEKPSHFTAPAMHKTREQVAELFSEVTGKDEEADIARLVEIARSELRQSFIESDIGISGANIAISETGTLVIVANEGNDRLVTTLPPVHIAIVGYEKLVENVDDANEILKVLSKSATGQKQTAYVSFITGPSRTTDIEKTLALGVHGPKEVHVIFVDGGRKRLAADEECKEALYCIKCGACLNMCPVYRSVGGHAFGNAYMGGIGAVLTAFLRSYDEAEDTANICAGCMFCKSICPAKIDVPQMVVTLRKRLQEEKGQSVIANLTTGIVTRPGLFKNAARLAGMFAPLITDAHGRMRDLGVVQRIAGEKNVPYLAGSFFRDRHPEDNKSGKEGKVVFYAGCVMDMVYPDIAESIWQVLCAGKMHAEFPDGQTCCGAPMLYSGDETSVRKLMAKNIAALDVEDADVVVTGCPTCATVIKEVYPELARGTDSYDDACRLADRIVDFATYASKMDVSCGQPLAGMKITYHDPCHQVRGPGSGKCSREILRSLGAEVVEMNNSDECCGFAGSYSAKNIEISDAILRRKLENIYATEANVVVTDCPGCIIQIRGGLEKEGSDIRVMHSAEMLAESVARMQDG